MKVNPNVKSLALAHAAANVAGAGNPFTGESFPVQEGNRAMVTTEDLGEGDNFAELARQKIGELCAHLGVTRDAPIADDIARVVSEGATNAIRHGLEFNIDPANGGAAVLAYGTHNTLSLHFIDTDHASEPIVAEKIDAVRREVQAEDNAPEEEDLSAIDEAAVDALLEGLPDDFNFDLDAPIGTLQQGTRIMVEAAQDAQGERRIGVRTITLGENTVAKVVSLDIDLRQARSGSVQSAA